MITEALLVEIEDYCRRLGIKASTLGVRALGNSRYFERLERRAGRDADDAARLRAFMAANPPPETPSEQDAA